MSETQPTIAAAVIVAGGRVLLIQRQISEGELSWQFPAGKVEPGETPADAAVREPHEEVDESTRSRAGPSCTSPAAWQPVPQASLTRLKWPTSDGAIAPSFDGSCRTRSMALWPTISTPS